MRQILYWQRHGVKPDLAFVRLTHPMANPPKKQASRKTSRYSREQVEFNRAIAFIDATFAVALTLLITGLDIHDRASAFASLPALAGAVGPQLITFAIAFVVIAGYWLVHYRLVASYVAIDNANVVANLCLLAAIVLLPFSTASVGDPGTAHLPLATALMAVNVAAVSALYTIVWILASIPVAYLVSPGAARLSWLLLLAVNPLVGHLAVGAGSGGDRQTSSR